MGKWIVAALTAGMLMGCTNEEAVEAGPQDRPIWEDASLPAWERQAERRIDRHRKGDFVVRVVDGAGRPVDGAEVAVEMTRHAFPFGTAISSRRLAETTDNDPYRTWILKLFNRGVPENCHKWRMQEDPNWRARAELLTEWCNAHDLSIHAHVMIWSTIKWGALPKDVAARATDANLPGRAEYVRRRSLEHIADVGKRYRGRVDEWDVINENFSEHVISDVVHPDVPKERAPILVEWIEAARRADPDARLYVNDFGILVGDQEKHKKSYEQTIAYLIEQDAPLGGIGMQAHYVSGWHRRTPGQLMATLDRFGRFGLPIQITEFDMWGKGWGKTPEEIDANQAKFMHEFLVTVFSHPSVNGFTMWGFWDGRHWMKNAPLFEADWTPKRGFDVYRELVFDRWWTRRRGKAGNDGRYAFRGFRGDYRIGVRTANRSAIAYVTFDADGREATVTLE
jgi:GH35 family endo-1,4-beta-xylanase